MTAGPALVTANRTAPAAATAAPTPQARSGGGWPGPGSPLVNDAISSSTAIPSAVPS